MPKSTEPAALETNPPFETELKIIPGDTRLLLIAPHGFHDTEIEDDKNDEYTGEIPELLLYCFLADNYWLPEMQPVVSIRATPYVKMRYPRKSISDILFLNAISFSLSTGSRKPLFLKSSFAFFK